MIIKKNEIYLLKGACEFGLISGSVEITGNILKSGDTLTVPKGKNVPLEALTDCKIMITGEIPEKLAANTIPPEWGQLVKKIILEKLKRIVILGEMDTGKSFLTTYIANKLLQSNIKVSVLDTDVGQSDVGPPGTIGLLIPEKPGVFFSQQEPTALSFIGSHSPGSHLLPLITGIIDLKDKALNKSDVLLVNTSGWVSGDAGRALKRAKLDILLPDLIILMQRADELEHLIKIYEPKKIERITVSRKASDTSKADRKDLRNLSSIRYFKGSQKIKLQFDDVNTDRCYFKTGVELKNTGITCIFTEKLANIEGILVVSKKPLIEKEIRKLNSKKFYNIKNIVEGDEKGMLVGLLDSDSAVICLGIIERIDYKSRIFEIYAPKSDNRIRVIQFGSLRYTLEGKEDGYFEPGYF